MAVVGVVKAIITADTTQFKKGMTDAQNRMDAAGRNMSKAGKSLTMKVTQGFHVVLKRKKDLVLVVGLTVYGEIKTY